MKGRELLTPRPGLLHHIGVCVFPLTRPNAKAFAEIIGPMIALAAIDDGVFRSNLAWFPAAMEKNKFDHSSEQNRRRDNRQLPHWESEAWLEYSQKAICDRDH